MAETSSQPRRRWLRFSLRALLLLMLAIGASLGWLNRELARGTRQRQAIEALEKVGCEVEHYSLNSLGLDESPPILDKLRELLGKDPVEIVREVIVKNRPITDAELAPLEALTELDVLVLQGTQVTNAGLAHVRSLTQLTSLDLDGSQITDQGMVDLRGLTNLRFLRLYGTQVTDAGLANLKGMAQLELLGLSKTQVTDAGLVHLRGLHNLNYLFLERTPVTDAAVDELKRALPNLNVRR